MKYVGLYIYTRSCLIIQIFCLLQVTVESISVNIPLLNSYPCGDKDIKVTFKPGSHQKEINHLYVKINKNIPANSVVKVSFDAEVYIFMDGKDKWTNMLVNAGDSMEVRFTETQTGFSFIVKGTAPRRANLTSLSIGGVEYCKHTYQCDTGSQKYGKPDFQCGRRIIHPMGVTEPISGFYMPQDTGSVTDGLATLGHWPWHGSVLLLTPSRSDTVTTYTCGGTLVSKVFVITAAHCLQDKGPEYISVDFGEQDIILYGLIMDNNSNTYQANVAEVIIHENYDNKNYLNNIALLKLKSAVQFTDFIRPACIWHRRRQSDLINATGVLAGWGVTNNNFYSRPLQQVNLPLVSDEICVKSNPITASRFLNGNNFCVGYFHAGTHPCSGDDGGAFQVFIPDAINDNGEIMSGSWYIKGVLSFFVNRHGEPSSSCDNTESYTVFTDLEKYAEWLETYLDA